MILTGAAIHGAWRNGTIVIDPFEVSNLNPNSYNYHLGPALLVSQPGRSGGEITFSEVTLPPQGYLLLPQTLYLGSTAEKLGSHFFVATLLGRSSSGRLGLYLNTTADLGHVGAVSHWTLELSVVQPLRIYAGMCVGQIAFWTSAGASTAYRGRYLGDAGPVANRDVQLVGGQRAL